jgi:molybdopterin converting factor small subunit
MECLTGGRREVDAEGATVAELIASLDAQFPGMAERLVDDSGLRRFVNVYVGGTDARFLSGLATAVTDQQRVTILPAP